MIDRKSKIYATAALLTMSLMVHATELDNNRIQELSNLVKHDCGACHGLTMKGGLGPALTSSALASKDKQALVQTILTGRPGTAMPPWKFMLTENEAGWIVEQLHQGLSSE